MTTRSMPVAAVGGIRGPFATAATIGGGCVALALWNPGDHGVPLCPTKILTGLDCPLCGGLRAVASLTRGHLVRAADHNLLVALVAPIALIWWLTWVRAARNGRPAPRPTLSRAATTSIVAVVVAFTIVRNLPIAGVPRWLSSTTS